MKVTVTKVVAHHTMKLYVNAYVKCKSRTNIYLTKTTLNYFWSSAVGSLQQADGAIGEPSDESDFSLLAWDSFSQEIRDLFTVVRSITSDYLYSIVKTL